MVKLLEVDNIKEGDILYNVMGRIGTCKVLRRQGDIISVEFADGSIHNTYIDDNMRKLVREKSRSADETL